MKAVFSRRIIIALACTFFVAANSFAFSQQPAPVVEHAETPDGVEYGLWNATSRTEAAPTLFVLASSTDETLGDKYFRQCGNQLAEQGWLCVTIDLPCHGKQAIDGEPSGLQGWSHRLANGEDIVAECNERLSKVLNHLINKGITDPNRIAACGTSRGGFLAIHLAAFDKRVKCAAAFAPVTDPAVVREFVANADHPLVKKVSLTHQADQLAGRPVWVVIGDQDDRVGTDRAFEFAQAVTAASRNKKIDSRIELHIMPEPRGHTTPRGSAERAAKWILQQFSRTDAPESTAE